MNEVGGSAILFENKSHKNADALGFRKSLPGRSPQCGGNPRVRRTWTAALGLVGRLSGFSCEPSRSVLLPGARTLQPQTFPSGSWRKFLPSAGPGVLRSPGAFILPPRFARLLGTSPCDGKQYGLKKNVWACPICLRRGIAECPMGSLFLTQMG